MTSRFRKTYKVQYYHDVNIDTKKWEVIELPTNHVIKTFDFEEDADEDLTSLDISSQTEADSSITDLGHAITRLNAERATYGSVLNRLEYVVDNLSNVSQNTSASRSQVLDADYASETTELARTQIIQQAATAMLSQANQQAQSVLALLK